MPAPVRHSRASQRHVTGTAGLLLMALLGPAGHALAQQQPTPPPFRTETSLVTVDVVVVDERGQPVPNLTVNDFEVLDEGVVQKVDFLQAVGTGSGAAVSTGSVPAAADRRVPYSTNTGTAATTTRTFVIVFDDLHLTREQGERARQALTGFVKTQLADGDLVTLIVPGSALRWHARLPEGRDELLRIADGLRGRLQPEPTFERITDYEAYRIQVFQDEVVADQVNRRWQNYRVLGREAPNLANDPGFQPQSRGGTAGVIKPDIAIRAADVYSRLMARNRVTLGAMRAMVEGLESVRGRKSVLLLSSGLIEDQEQLDARHVLHAARRANVAIYFVDIRGIESGSGFSTAQYGSPLDTRDVGAPNAQIELEVQGSENLAIDTGGFSVRNANDLDRALSRISRELSSYYLLGFQPQQAGTPGSYRRLQVRVRREGVRVRARRGYYVDGPAPGGRGDTLSTGGSDALQRATDSPYDLGAIPLRVASFVFGQPDAGKALVMLALEADLRAFAFATRETSLVDILDLRIAATHLETSTAERYDGQVEMTFAQGTRFGEDSWHGLAREFRLAPGRYQARIAVRDRNSGRIGSVTHAFDVPPLEGFRITTPIVTDTVQSPTGGVPTPVLVVRRDFPAGATVYYQFTVLGVPSGARVLAGHQVRNAKGELIKQLEPRAITPGPDGSRQRFAGLAMVGLPAGLYELRLTVTDGASGATVERREPFTLLPPQREP